MSKNEMAVLIEKLQKENQALLNDNIFLTKELESQTALSQDLFLRLRKAGA